MTTPVLYYDLGSPYAYLAVERAADVLGVEPLLQPILLGAIIPTLERLSTTVVSSRSTVRLGFWRDATDDAIARGVEGIPSLRTGDRVVYGDDRLELAS